MAKAKDRTTWDSDPEQWTLLTGAMSNLISRVSSKTSAQYWPPLPETNEEINTVAKEVFVAEEKYVHTEANILPFEAGKTWPISRHELKIQQIEKETKEMQEKRIKHIEELEKNKTIGPPSVSASIMSLATESIVPFYQKVNIIGDYASGVTVDDYQLICQDLHRALSIREKYMRLSLQRFPSTVSQFLHAIHGNTWNKTEEKQLQPTFPSRIKEGEDPYRTDNLPENLEYQVIMRDGVIHVYADKNAAERDDPVNFTYTKVENYIKDYNFVVSLIARGSLNTYATQRLNFHSSKFKLHMMLNELNEMKEVKESPQDFYTCRKVDTHIHAAACMSARHLLSFMKHTYKDEADRIVSSIEAPTTLKELYGKLNLKPNELTVDSLDVHAGHETFHRFDTFNSKYNPMGASQLRELYLKTDNYIGGEYFAKVLKEVGSELFKQRYVYTEPRLSIYGQSPHEWQKLAEWFCKQKVYAEFMKWMIQVPRIYDIFRKKNVVPDFGKYLENIFLPLFEATCRPQDNKELSVFLRHVTSFDSVDDESKHSSYVFTSDSPKPQDWTMEKSPTYSYYIFYMYANITVLNKFRKARGMNTFLFRPHCGEAGAVVHLASAFLAADNISHGLGLERSSLLQYLYYLCKVPIAMSPLSNNSLFLEYSKSPFSEFFEKGLMVSLSTDDPLLFHYTKEPLMEEYAIAAQVFSLNTCDMCEIARNSVLQSALSHEEKAHFLGDNYLEDGPAGNEIKRSNVAQIRMSYRYETWVYELNLIYQTAKLAENK
ncbi:AMP deaminase 1-like [Lissotriton helveticus]